MSIGHHSVPLRKKGLGGRGAEIPKVNRASYISGKIESLSASVW